MKTITGYLAILLGAVGVLITLAAIGLVWWGAFQLTTQVQKLTTQTDQSLVQVEDSLDRLGLQLVSITESVEAVRVDAEKAAKERPNAALTKAENERLRGNLLPLIERADAISESLQPIAQMVENAANLAEQSGGKPRADRLRAIAASVRDAAKELESVRDQAAAIRRGESTPTVKELADLAQQTRKPLDRLATALSDVKKESERLRKDLPETRRELDEWKTAGAGILTGVLLWVGLGQLAIISWGRRRLAPPPVPQTTTTAK